MENIETTNFKLLELEEALQCKTCQGMLGRNKVKYDEKVCHLDIVVFDVYSYKYEGRTKALSPGEDRTPITCYAIYSQCNKEVTLHSFPGSSRSIIDNLTKAKARFCSVEGNLRQNGRLLYELRQLLKGCE